MDGWHGALQAALVGAVGLDLKTVVPANLIIGSAAFVSSMTGFGYALVATPFMALLLPPRTAVPVVMVSWVPLAALLMAEARSRMQWRRIGRWTAGALVGIPLGVYGLAVADPGTMRTVIGVVTLMAALTLWLKPARPLRSENLVAPLAGVVSGVMGGATGMSGPPVILFGLNQAWEAPALRANLIGYFAIKHVLSIIFLAGFGVLDSTTLALGVAALPGMLAGYAAGIRLKERVAYRHFRALALCLVCIGGLLAVIRR